MDRVSATHVPCFCFATLAMPFKATNLLATHYCFARGAPFVWRIILLILAYANLR
jgi:hypothetical protein